NLNQVISALPSMTGTGEEVEVSVKVVDFTKVEIDKFYSSKKVLFDVYVKLSENHFVKILHAGDDFSNSRIEKYKEKKVEYLYFHKSDRRKYVMFVNQLAGKIVQSEK